jgi:hypothetical protein
LALASGSRFFALAMVRADAEQRNEPFNYAVGADAGTARILALPPSFR